MIDDEENSVADSRHMCMGTGEAISNPFYLYTFVSTLTDYISVDEMKIMRITCKTIRDLISPAIKKKTEVRIHTRRDQIEFMQDYEPDRILLKNLPFENFSFAYGLTNDDNREKMTEFISKFEHHIFRIKIIGYYAGQQNEITWLIESATNLESVCIKSNCKLSAKSLLKIKKLCLHTCTLVVDVENDCKLKPRKLCVSNVRCTQDEKFIEDFLINKIVNFKICSRITMKSNEKTSHFQLAFCATDEDYMCKYIVKLKLHDVKLYNIDKSTSHVNKAEFVKCNIAPKISMHIKHGHFEDCILDFQGISRTIETMSLGENNKYSRQLQRGGFQKLKSITLPAKQNEPMSKLLNGLPSFCPFIYKLELQGETETVTSLLTIDVQQVPDSVIVMSINGMMTFAGEGTKQLQKLVVRNCELSAMSQMMTKLKPRVLIIHLQSEENPNHEISSLARVIAFVAFNAQWCTVYFGIPPRRSFMVRDRRIVNADGIYGMVVFPTVTYLTEDKFYTLMRI